MHEWPAGIELFAVLSVATLIIILPTNIKVGILLAAGSWMGIGNHVREVRDIVVATPAISNAAGALTLCSRFWPDCAVTVMLLTL